MQNPTTETQPTEKRTWITPDFELISSNDIRGGTSRLQPEGFVVVPGYTGSAS